jgi:hypothetical protein
LARLEDDVITVEEAPGVRRKGFAAARRVLPVDIGGRVWAVEFRRGGRTAGTCWRGLTMT